MRPYEILFALAFAIAFVGVVLLAQLHRRGGEGSPSPDRAGAVRPLALPTAAELLTLFACLSVVLGPWPLLLLRHARNRLTGAVS